MGVRRASRTGRPRLLLLSLASMIVTATVVVVGLERGPEPTQPPQRPSKPIATPMDALDLSGLPIARGSFCDLIDERSVTTALGAPVAASLTYGNGDRTRLSAGLRDVSHEYGCSYRSADGTGVRAWVFAEPVLAPEARVLVRQVSGGAGCREPSGAPTFGRPGVTVICRTDEPAATTLSMRGLFTDSWLSCELTVPDPDADGAATARRGMRWCVHLATTLGARP